MPQQATATKQSKPRFQFIGEIISEMKKVVWLSRREITYLAGLVLIVSILFGLILGFLDLGFTKLVDAILSR